jgi:prepilin-type N-terminal cleavage/methylation domain-containing protein
MSWRPAKKQQGFTIVELMIATLVFSLVIILITVGVLSFTRSYYKGVNQSGTQSTARLIIEDIAQAIQFSGGAVQPVLGTSTSGNSQGICIGNVRYSFVKGKQFSTDATLTADQAKHGLVSDKGSLCAGSDAQDVEGASVVGTELLSPNMRLSKLVVAPVAGTTDMYSITIRIVYGDADLLVNPTADDARCQTGISGTQYCAQSELTTIVKKRIAQ